MIIDFSSHPTRWPFHPSKVIHENIHENFHENQCFLRNHHRKAMITMKPIHHVLSSWNCLPVLKSQRISALVISDSKTISTNQRCFSSDSGLYITLKSLNSANSALFSVEKSISKSALNSVDFSWIQDDIFSWTFDTFRNISKYLNFKAQSSAVHPALQKEVNNKKAVVQPNLLSYVLQIFKSIFLFSGVNFQNYFGIFFEGNLRKFTFLEYLECHFKDHLKHFYYLRITPWLTLEEIFEIFHDSGATLYVYNLSDAGKCCKTLGCNMENFQEFCLKPTKFG